MLVTTVALSISLTSSHAAERQLPKHSSLVYAESLPLWGAILEKSTWVATTEPINPGAGTKPWPDGQLKDFKFDESRMPKTGLLPGGWTVTPASATKEGALLSSGVLEFTLIQPATGARATWRIPKPSRLSQLTKSKQAAITGAALIADEYVAFSISDGSIILFDWHKGVFGAAAVKASNRNVKQACEKQGWNFVTNCTGDVTVFHRTPDGQIVVYSPITNDYRAVPTP